MIEVHGVILPNAIWGVDPAPLFWLRRPVSGRTRD
jgi:hypothetical protein